MANVYDQFDTPAADDNTGGAASDSAPNVYDQFDEPAPQSTSAAGAVQATGAGFTRGIADLAGLPVDTARNIIELSKVVPGVLYHEATGNPIPDFLQPNEQQDVGSSQWIKDQIRKRISPDAVDPVEKTTATRYLGAAAEAIPGALVGADTASIPSAARAVTGGALAGTAQQGIADAGGGTVSQAIAGFAGGAAAERTFAPKAAPKVTTPARSTESTVPSDSGGFAVAERPTGAPAKQAPAGGNVFDQFDPSQPSRDPSKLAVGGMTTAAEDGKPLPELQPLNRTPAPTTEADQAARAQTLRDVGLTEARESAITSDTKEAGTDYQTAKLQNSSGDLLSGTIAKERAALQGYARDITENTGGTVGADENSLYQRGQTIAKPVEDLGDYFDDKIKNAYAAADQKAGGLPLEMPSTQQFLTNERAQFLGTVEGKQLREGVQARMRDLGLMDQDGNVQPATVAQSERLKQYLSDQWTPRTSRLISQAKGAIDEDVTRAAGSDIYADARATRALRSTLLDDPDGIAKLAPPEDRTGVNRAVPLERTPDYVTTLPVDQFRHLVTTFREAPPEVQPSAAAALNEIRAQFANNVEKAGNSNQVSWNAKKASDYLRQNQLRMAEVFTRDEMNRFKTLHDAGKILHMDSSYPGAEAQRYNLAVRGANLVGKGAAVAATAIGGHGGPLGAMVGHSIGKAVGAGAEKLSEKTALSQTQKRIRNLYP
jgi:hypothetical protein